MPLLRPVLRLAAILLLAATGARAHLTHDQIRVFVASDDGRTVYLRTPLPLVFAAEIETARAARAPLASAYLYREALAYGARYRVSVEALAADEAAFRARLEELFAFTRGGEHVGAELSAFRLHARAPRGPFGTLKAARRVLAGPSTRLDPVFGEAVLDLRYDLAGGPGPLEVRRVGPAIDLPDGIEVTNRLVRDAGASLAVVAVSGQLRAAATFPAGTGDGPAGAGPLPWLIGAAGIAALVLGRLRSRRVSRTPRQSRS